jgi:hypothetical protein
MEVDTKDRQELLLDHICSDCLIPLQQQGAGCFICFICLQEFGGCV